MQTPSPSATYAPRQILVVEDDRDLSQLVQMHLRDAGYSCQISHDGADGLTQMETHDYDLVVLDLMLPRTRWPRGLSSGARAQSLHAYYYGDFARR